MSNPIEDIQTYAFSKADSLLLDANVWLRVYGPQANPKSSPTKAYSAALKQILTANSRVYIDVTVLSEFINRWARLEYQYIPAAQRPRSFKDYRDSSAFNPVAAAIAKAAQDIVDQCKRTESGFETIDIAALLKTFSGGDSDFGDLILIDLCRKKNLKFVTHDADFKDSGLDLLTASPKLLSA